MDYKTYLDFVLALENRQEPQSLQYLFRILDLDHQGYLTSFTLNYFFKVRKKTLCYFNIKMKPHQLFNCSNFLDQILQGIQEQIEAHRAEPVNFDDVKDEIFDMIKPRDPTKITLKDIIDSGQGETMVSILIEFHKFWAYENREAMVVDSNIEEHQSIL